MTLFPMYMVTLDVRGCSQIVMINFHQNKIITKNKTKQYKANNDNLYLKRKVDNGSKTCGVC